MASIPRLSIDGPIRNEINSNVPNVLKSEAHLPKQGTQCSDAIFPERLSFLMERSLCLLGTPTPRVNIWKGTQDNFFEPSQNICFQ